MLVYVNGQWLDEKEASISIFDRGFVFADAIYEVVRIYDGRYFHLDRHLRRMERSLSAIQLAFDGKELETICLQLLAHRKEIKEGSLYIQVSRGAGERVHGLPQDLTPTVVAYIKDLQNLDRSLQEQGGKAIFYEDTRWLMCNIKTVGLLINCLAKDKATSKGAQDAIFHRGDIVTEGTASNLFIVKNGILLTHPEGNLILSGITRQVVIELAQQLGIPVEERPFTKQELLAADELFFTGTISEITPYIQVEGQPIGDGRVGSVTRRLQDAFSRLTRTFG